jgi:hypothetical protein
MSRPVSADVAVAADVESAWRALTGPGWPVALDAALRDGSRLVGDEPTADGGMVVVVSRRLPDGVPSAVQHLLPRDGRVTQTDTWGPAVDGARSGTWSVHFAGAPGNVGGQLALTPGPGGCTWSVRGTISITVPLVGGRIEAFLAPLIEKLVVRQGQVLHDLLD